jgi:hypothetical protein
MTSVCTIVIIQVRANCHLPAVREQRHCQSTGVIISPLSIDVTADFGPIELGIIHSIDPYVTGINSIHPIVIAGAYSNRPEEHREVAIGRIRTALDLLGT